MDNYEKVTIKDKLILKVTLFSCVLAMVGLTDDEAEGLEEHLAKML